MARTCSRRPCHRRMVVIPWPTSSPCATPPLKTIARRNRNLQKMSSGKVLRLGHACLAGGSVGGRRLAYHSVPKLPKSRHSLGRGRRLWRARGATNSPETSPDKIMGPGQVSRPSTAIFAPWPKRAIIRAPAYQSVPKLPKARHCLDRGRRHGRVRGATHSSDTSRIIGCKVRLTFFYFFCETRIL